MEAVLFCLMGTNTSLALLLLLDCIVLKLLPSIFVSHENRDTVFELYRSAGLPHYCPIRRLQLDWHPSSDDYRQRISHVMEYTECFLPSSQ